MRLSTSFAWDYPHLTFAWHSREFPKSQTGWEALATGTRCIGVAAMVAGCGQARDKIQKVYSKGNQFGCSLLLRVHIVSRVSATSAICPSIPTKTRATRKSFCAAFPGRAWLPCWGCSLIFIDPFYDICDTLTQCKCAVCSEWYKISMIQYDTIIDTIDTMTWRIGETFNDIQ